MNLIRRLAGAAFKPIKLPLAKGLNIAQFTFRPIGKYAGFIYGGAARLHECLL